jgi:hypothetical protein
VTTRRRSRQDGRTAVLIRADTSVANLVRRAAVGRGDLQWAVVEAALQHGLPRLAPADAPLPHYAYDHTKLHGRDFTQMKIALAPAVAAQLHAAAAERHAHMWWVAQEAIQLGIPLLPEPARAPALDYAEELPQSA